MQEAAYLEARGKPAKLEEIVSAGKQESAAGERR